MSVIYKGLLKTYDVYKPIVAAVRGFCVAGRYLGFAAGSGFGAFGAGASSPARMRT